MSSIWGEGLYSKRYWGGRLWLRRNSLVYEVILNLVRTRIIFTIQRK